jgi:hypothetical protein
MITDVALDIVRMKANAKSPGGVMSWVPVGLGAQEKSVDAYELKPEQNYQKRDVRAELANIAYDANLGSIQDLAGCPLWRP